jgi:NAD(P)H dehydrogenase (quinone)
MKTLVIYCHPSEQSHNFKILEEVRSVLNSHRLAFEVLDLYKSGFSPCLQKREYDCIRNREKKHCENDVFELQEKVRKSEVLIFIYPVWWYSMPAALKGFMDRVFTNGFAYRFTKVGKISLFFANILSFFPGLRYLFQPMAVNGLLKGKKALIFRTYGGPPMGLRFFGNTSRQVLDQAILRFCGITDIQLHELWNTDKSVYTQEYEDAYMKKIEVIIKALFN